MIICNRFRKSAKVLRKRKEAMSVNSFITIKGNVNNGKATT